MYCILPSKKLCNINCSISICNRTLIPDVQIQERKVNMEQSLEQPKQEPVEVKMGDGSDVQVETPPAEDNSSSDIHEGHTYE